MSCCVIFRPSTTAMVSAVMVTAGAAGGVERHAMVKELSKATKKPQVQLVSDANLASGISGSVQSRLAPTQP